MDRDVPAAFHQHLVDALNVVDIASVGCADDTCHGNHELTYTAAAGFVRRIPAGFHYLWIVDDLRFENGPNLFRGNGINSGQERDPYDFDIEIAAEFGEAGVSVCADDDMGTVFVRAARAVFVIPVPLVSQQREHDGLGRANRSSPNHARFVSRVIGMEQISRHGDDLLVDRFGVGVLGHIHQVLVDALVCELFRLGFHPRGNERRDVEMGQAFEL